MHDALLSVNQSQKGNFVIKNTKLELKYLTKIKTVTMPSTSNSIFTCGEFDIYHRKIEIFL